MGMKEMNHQPLNRELTKAQYEMGSPVCAVFANSQIARWPTQLPAT